MIKLKQLYFLNPSIRGFMIMAESEIKAGNESDVTSPSEQGLDFDEETLKGKNSLKRFIINGPREKSKIFDDKKK